MRVSIQILYSEMERIGAVGCTVTAGPLDKFDAQIPTYIYVGTVLLPSLSLCVCVYVVDAVRSTDLCVISFLFLIRMSTAPAHPLYF